MLTTKFIRENQEKVLRAAEIKHLKFSKGDLDQILSLDENLRVKKQEFDEIRAKKKQIRDREEAMVLKEREKVLEGEIRGNEKNLEKIMLRVPNIVHETVPEGKDDSENVEIECFGEILNRVQDDNFLDHLQICEKRGWLDDERAAKVAGSRAKYLCGGLARLQWAVLSFAMDCGVKNGFEPVICPSFANYPTMVTSAFFPGAEDDVFRLDDRDGKWSAENGDENSKWLIATAENALMGRFQNEILDLDEPKKMCGISACFRREAGSYGKDTKGLYRVNEFYKIEQVVLCKADEPESMKIYEKLMENHLEILRGLELPHRMIQICGGDLSMHKYLSHDAEAWMPSRESWGETGSNSNILDFQCRRGKIRYRDENGKSQTAFSLNCTMVAVPRVLIALLENHQLADGSGKIRIPEALRKYLGGEEYL